jgi:hypothetical protein
MHLASAPRVLRVIVRLMQSYEHSHHTCCKRLMSKAEVAVLLVFVVGYLVVVWLLAKAN